MLKHFVYVFLTGITIPLAWLKCRLGESRCLCEQSRILCAWWVLSIFKNFSGKLWHSNSFCCSCRSFADFISPATIPACLLPVKNTRGGICKLLRSLQPGIQDVGLWRAGSIRQPLWLAKCGRKLEEKTGGEGKGAAGEPGLAGSGGIISVAGPWLLPRAAPRGHCLLLGTQFASQRCFSGCSL